MTGAEFRNSLKADASLADVPVVLLSALPDIHTHAAAMGVDGYLRKPVDGKLLLAVVEGYCR